ncbi:MAG: hypothetical protein AB7E52_04030 [Bdellovibrionales bacterium]
MKLMKSLLLAGAAVLCFSAGAAMAETAPVRPTEAQMKAVHDCAAAKGVEMPTPPAGGPPKGEKEKGAGGPPPESGKGKGGPGPKLTDAQRAIIDACFAEQGLTPPKGPPHGGKGPHGGQASE